MWSDGTGYAGTDGKGVYKLLVQLMTESSSENVGNPCYQKALKALDDQTTTKSWNVRVHGDFWIVEGDADGTILVPESNHGMVYKCVGMKDSIWPMVAGKHPGLIQMTLTMIPGYGRLVYDGVLVPPHGLPVPPVAGSELEASLKETVAKAKIEGRVISRLAQLEVEGGS